MPVSGFNTGSDYSLFIYDGLTQDIIDLGLIENLTAEADKHDVEATPYNGPPRRGFIHNGWKGTFEIVRTSPALEDLMLARNQAFDQGLTIPEATIQEVVRNVDGTVSRYQYRGVALFMTKVVDAKREDKVSQTVEWTASDKVPV